MYVKALSKQFLQKSKENGKGKREYKVKAK